jgi:hypothetical protein
VVRRRRAQGQRPRHQAQGRVLRGREGLAYQDRVRLAADPEVDRERVLAAAAADRVVLRSPSPTAQCGRSCTPRLADGVSVWS